MVRCFAAIAAALVFGLCSPAHGAPPLEAYGHLPAVDLVDLSPNGERLAYVKADGRGRKVFVTDLAGKVLQSAELDKVKLRDLAWAGDGHVLVTMSSTVQLSADALQRFEVSSVAVLNPDARKALLVFGGNTRIVNAVIGSFGAGQIKGSWYGYFGGLTLSDGSHLLHGYPDLYGVDLDTGAAGIVATGDEHVAGWLVAPTGAVIARSEYDEKTGDWSVHAGPFVGKVIASGNDRYGQVSVTGRGRTAGSVLLRHVSDGEPYREVPLQGGVARPGPAGERVRRFLFDRAAGLWIGAVSEEDYPQTRLFDERAAAALAKAAELVPGRRPQLASWSTDFRRIVLFTQGDGDSGTYWLIDAAAGTAKPLGVAYPEIAASAVGPSKVVSWKASDGLEIHGVLTLPPGREPKSLPVVVLPHGGPQARDYPGFDWWAQAFAARGYAVLQPNFRGSSGYGEDFVAAGLGQWGRKMQTDVSEGLASLASQGMVDAKRACIAGASYGGYVALAGVTLQQGLYRCAVSVAGVSDPSDMLFFEGDRQGVTSSATRYWRDFIGATSTNDPALKAISPLNFAGRADAPVLLIHGRQDTVVDFAQSRRMEAALRRAGKPVELVALPAEDHWLSREDTRTAMLRAAVAFVEKHNPPG